MGILRRVGRQGDISQGWEVDDKGSVREATRVLDEMLSKGGVAFAFDREGGGGRQLEAFDPSAKEIVVFPAIAGG